ncbi:unnamed protein product, partial [Iphiclides podalirius]
MPCDTNKKPEHNIPHKIAYLAVDARSACGPRCARDRCERSINNERWRRYAARARSHARHAARRQGIR